MSALLIADKEYMTSAWLPGEVTDGAVCVVDHVVRCVCPLNLSGGNVGAERNILCFSFYLFTCRRKDECMTQVNITTEGRRKIKDWRQG